MMIDRYQRAYQQYCWPVRSIADLKLAPFHLLATEGRVHTDKDHVWQMETLAKMCAADTGLLLATPYKVVDITDPVTQSEGIRWWEELTASGGEGMVVKYPVASLMIQAINHSTEHRTQVSTIITQLGLEPPDMTGWAYMEEIGEFQEIATTES